MRVRKNSFLPPSLHPSIDLCFSFPHIFFIFIFCPFTLIIRFQINLDWLLKITINQTRTHTHTILWCCCFKRQTFLFWIIIKFLGHTYTTYVHTKRHEVVLQTAFSTFLTYIFIYKFIFLVSTIDFGFFLFLVSIGIEKLTFKQERTNESHNFIDHRKEKITI